MLLFILSILFILIGVGAVIVIKIDEDDDLVPVPAIAAVAGPLIGVGMLIASFTTHVGSREVGIVTSLSKYDQTVGPGWHFTKPWSSVERFTTRIQTTDLAGVPVTLKAETKDAPGATAKVTARIRWHIAEANNEGEAARDLWFKYRNFDTVTKQLVRPEAQTSTREAMGDYTPKAAKDGHNIRLVGRAVYDNLRKAISDDGIVIDSVSVTDVDLDDTVEKRLRDAVAAEGDLARARIATERAKEEARANAARQTSLTREALIQQCLEVTDGWDVSKSGPLPAVWTCVGGSGATPVLPVK